MAPHTNILNLPPEILEMIIERIGSNKKIAKISRLNNKLKSSCERVLHNVFRTIEKKSNKTNLKLLSAYLMLIRASTWPNLETGLCTLKGGELLDCYAKHANGQMFSRRDFHKVTCDYLKGFRKIIDRKCRRTGCTKERRFIHASTLIRLLKSYKNNICNEVLGDSLCMDFTLPGSWMGILYSQRGGCMFRYPLEYVMLYNVLTNLTCASNASYQFTFLRNCKSRRINRVLMYCHNHNMITAPSYKLKIFVKIQGDANWLAAFKNGVYECPKNEFSFKMKINSPEAQKKGCCREYRFNIEPTTNYPYDMETSSGEEHEESGEGL